MKKISISCLPVAGIENPYQYLMMEGLRTGNLLSVRSGIHDRFLGIIRTAAIHRPDYIHFDWETSFYYRRSLVFTLVSIPLFMLQVYIARFVFGCRLVWTPHNIVPHDSAHLKIHRFCRRFFAGNMQWIRLFSEKSQEAAAKEFNCKTGKFRIVPEGSYVNYYVNTVTPAAARVKLNIDSSKRVLLYLGLIKPYKGITELIETFNKYRQAGDVLIIAGKIMNDEYGEQVKGMLNDSILLTNRFIKDDELQVYFNAANVVVLPFRKIENSGSAILAMGFKKAIIAPAMGVLTERLENQPELLYNNNLGQALQVFKNIDKEKLDRLGELNFQCLSKFQWTDFTKVFKEC